MLLCDKDRYVDNDRETTNVEALHERSKALSFSLVGMKGVEPSRFFRTPVFETSMAAVTSHPHDVRLCFNGKRNRKTRRTPENRTLINSLRANYSTIELASHILTKNFTIGTRILKAHKLSPIIFSSVKH